MTPPPPARKGTNRAAGPTAIARTAEEKGRAAGGALKGVRTREHRAASPPSRAVASAGRPVGHLLGWLPGGAQNAGPIVRPLESGHPAGRSRSQGRASTEGGGKRDCGLSHTVRGTQSRAKSQPWPRGAAVTEEDHGQPGKGQRT